MFSRFGLLVSSLLAAVALSACTSSHHAARTGVDQPIVIDGDLSEWPIGAVAWADENAYYLRVESDGRWPLQAARETTVIVLDLDADARTGAKWEGEDFGADLVLRFSPPSGREPGTFGPGLSGETFTPNGASTPQHQSRLGVVVSPTFAAPMHEIRIARTSAALESAPAATAVCFRGRVERRDASGALLSAGPIFVCNAPARSDVHLAAVAPPAKGASELRVVSFNVLWNSPMKNPAPFARMLRALDPDIVLVQEWDQRSNEEPLNTSAQIESWFRANMPGDHAWTAHRGAGRGVAIVSKYPVRPLIDSLKLRSEAKGGAGGVMEQDVRYVAAMVDSPIGPVLASSVHLKCCGSSDGPEELRRTAEAVAINAALRDIVSRQRPVTTIIAGDFNLVGSNRPLEVVRSGLDADRSDLYAAPALVWGDRARYTFNDPAGPFQPGALDYVLVGDAQVEVVRSFVFDASLLGEPALREIDLLEAPNGAMSDHLPTVVDLRARVGAGR